MNDYREKTEKCISRLYRNKGMLKEQSLEQDQITLQYVLIKLKF